MRQARRALDEAGVRWRDDVGALDADLLRAASMAVRRGRLEAALAARGLRLRQDSELCRRYVAAGADGEAGLAAVVEAMDEMRFFYDRTDYARMLSLRRPPRYGAYGGAGYGAFDDAYDWHGGGYDRLEASRDAKEAALRRMGTVPADAPANVLRLARTLAGYGVRVAG